MSERSRTGFSGVGWVGIIAAASVLGVVAGAAIIFVFPFGLVLAPVIAVALPGVLVLLAAPSATERGRFEPSGSGRRLAVSMPFTVLTLAVVAAGAAHIAVWNPLSKVPGLELGELYAALDAAGETPNWVFLIAWAAIWSIAAVALPVVAVATRGVPAATDRRIAIVGLLLVAVTAMTSWIAGFNHGMSIADAFMTSGGDAAPSGMLILVFGLAAAVMAAVVAVAPRFGRERRGRAA